MSNDVMIPDDIPGGPAAIFQEKNLPVERLGEGVDSGGFNLVGIHGKEFYVRYKGQRHTLINPDAKPEPGMPQPVSQHFDFVVLRQGARTSHTWYQQGYQPGADKPPDCVSTDGIAPDDSSRLKQADLCQLCPQHEWKPQPNGRDGRACTDSLRLAILPMPKLITAVLGEPITEPILFRIPAASLRGFSEFGDQMAKRFGGNSPICSYVMRVIFKQSVQHPQFEYRLVRWLSENDAEMIFALRDDPLAFRILGLSPEGNSLVRKTQASGTIRQVAMPQSAPNNIDSQNVAQLQAKFDAERAARMAAVRQAPQQIEGRAEEIRAAQTAFTEVLIEPQVPLDETTPMSPGKPAPVADAPDDIDALVAAMRPRPPAG